MRDASEHSVQKDKVSNILCVLLQCENVAIRGMKRLAESFLLYGMFKLFLKSARFGIEMQFLSLDRNDTLE